jgi:hypothetical protein
MKKQIFGMLMTAVAVVALVAPLDAEQLSDENKKFLAAYEKARQALAADDLDGAKNAAADLGTKGSELANSKSLGDARAVFAKISAEAEKMVAGQPGYYVMHCPMLKKDWVQTTEKVANPYAGKQMLTCGEVKK